MAAGPALRAARLNRGLTTREVAAMLKLSRGTVVRAERGDGVYPATAKKLADFYGFKVTDLWPVAERTAA